MRWMWLAAAALMGGGILVVTVVIFCMHWEEVSYSLDFGSVLDAVVLLFVGAFVEYAYSRRSAERRADTDLLLEVVRDARNALSTLTRATHACGSERLTSAEMKSLTLADRELSNAIRSIEEGLKHCDIDMGTVNFSQLKSVWADLKSVVTDSPYPGPYDAASLGRIRRSLNAVRDELTRIAFTINRR